MVCVCVCVCVCVRARARRCLLLLPLNVLTYATSLLPVTLLPHHYSATAGNGYRPVLAGHCSHVLSLVAWLEPKLLPRSTCCNAAYLPGHERRGDIPDFRDHTRLVAHRQHHTYTPVGACNTYGLSELQVCVHILGRLSIERVVAGI